MSLDKSVYKLGDTIKVHVECSVKGGKADVDKCITLLVQEAVYITNMGFKDEQRSEYSSLRVQTCFCQTSRMSHFGELLDVVWPKTAQKRQK